MENEQRGYRPWTPEEDNTLIKVHNSAAKTNKARGFTKMPHNWGRKVAKRLCRSQQAVVSRSQELHIIQKIPKLDPLELFVPPPPVQEEMPVLNNADILPPNVGDYVKWKREIICRLDLIERQLSARLNRIEDLLVDLHEVWK